jgi:hypothetical protein
MSFLVVLYEFGILPFLLGMLWCQKDKKMGFHSIYVHGYMTMFALFFVIAVPFIHQGRSLSELAGAWRVAAILAPVGMAAKILFNPKIFKSECMYLLGTYKEAKEYLWGMVCVMAILLVFSVTMVIPSAEDDVPEIVGISIATDTMYVYQPYSQIMYANNLEKARSPIEMLYAVGAVHSDMNSMVMIHLLLPIFLIVLYFAVGWRISGYFFPGRLFERKIFALFWAIFPSVACVSVRNISIGILQNSWNGTTLLTCCVLPLMMVESFSCIDIIMEKKRLNWYNFVWIIIIMISAQLLLDRGLYLSAIILAMCVVVKILEKGLRYVGVLGKYKG